MSKYRKRNSIAESFISHRRSMRESFAWQFLPDNARRVLDRLELEHMRHGGAENGKLICTYSDFAKAGIRRASIALALRQCQALGFLECTRRGWCSISEFRTPSLYRLTYVYGRREYGSPTDEWSRVKSVEDALEALRRAASERHPDGAIDAITPAENIDSRHANEPRTVDAPARLMRRALVTR
jgi:hypothetical protein